MCLVHAVPHIQNYYLPHSHCYEQDSDSLVNLFVPARPSMIIWALHPELQLSRATPCLKSQPGLVNWIGYWETFAGISNSSDTSLCAQTVVQAPQKHRSPSSPRMAHASETPSQCPEERYPPQAPPGRCWGTYIATEYSVQDLVGSLDLHGGLGSEIHTAVSESLLQLFHIQLYFFFLPCCPGDITFVSSVSTKVLFSHFVLPPCYPFICFPPAVSLPSWTQESGTNNYFKSGGEAIGWKQIFFPSLEHLSANITGVCLLP